MNSNILFRPAERSDLPGLVELMNSQYARKKNESYFEWQYFTPYFPTVLMCAFSEEKVIGMFGVQKRLLNNGAIVGQAIDMLVDPAWRGKGIFSQLGCNALEYFENLDAFCVLPNLNGKNAVTKSLGFKNLNQINSMNVLPDELKSVENITVFENSSSNFDLNSFCKFDWNETNRNWRFQKNPVYKYERVYLPSGEFAVIKIFVDPMTQKRYGDVVDFDCSFSDSYKLLKLFFKTSQQLAAYQVESITTWALLHTILYQVLKLMGFTDTKQERFFCVKVINPDFNRLYDFTEWHLVQADAEIY